MSRLVKKGFISLFLFANIIALIDFLRPFLAKLKEPNKTARKFLMSFNKMAGAALRPFFISYFPFFFYREKSDVITDAKIISSDESETLQHILLFHW